MLEPVNTVLKAIKRLALLRNDNVLVAGQGPIGLLFTRLLQLNGARVIATDLLDTRLKMAGRMGASSAFRSDNPGLVELVKERAGKQGLDAAIICAPADSAVVQAQEMVNGAGKVLLFAHTRKGVLTPIDLSRVCADEKDLIGSYSADFTLQGEVARLVFSRTLDVRQVITHQFPLPEAPAAIDLASHPTEQSLKVMVVSGG